MPLSHDVNLPRDQKAIFPDRCVICNASFPDDVLSVRACDLRALSWILPLRADLVVPPACSPCRVRYKRSRLLRRVMQPIIVLVAAFVVFTFLPRGIAGRTWISVLLILLALAPFFIWQMLRPLPFDITRLSNTLDYEFADHNYAREFAELNGDAEVK